MNQITIKELLNNYHLVIPEIQREYVWGKRNEIFTQFLQSLKDASPNENFNTGFLYTYNRNGEQYIVDGQQRATTLVLLLYVLSLKSDRYNCFKELLKLNKPQIAFSYRVRTNTDQFMRDLFNSGIYEEEEILDSDWYHAYYDSDISIQSMIEFLNTVNVEGLTYDKILNVMFWYYPVEAASLGEELYISMNSRGKSLDDVERIKPHLFKHQKSIDATYNWGKEWDNWEEFFFQQIDDFKDVEKINGAMDRFIRMVWELETCGEHHELIPSRLIEEKINLPLLQKYFKALERLNRSDYKSEIKQLLNADKDRNLLILKSLICCCYRCVDNVVDNAELQRIRETVYNGTRRRGHLKHVSLLKFLKKYRTCDMSFYETVLACETDENAAFDNLDKTVIQLIQHYGTEVEQGFWKVWKRDVPAHNIWNGDLSLMIGFSKLEGGEFSYCKFKAYAELIDELLPKKAEHEDNVDLFRRAWIAAVPNYEPIQAGHYRSFGWEWADWRRFFDKYPTDLKRFLDMLVAKKNTTPITNVLENYIDETEDLKRDYIEFTTDDGYLIAFTHHSEACDIAFNWEQGDWQICVAGSRSRHTSFLSVSNAYILKAFGANSKHKNCSKDAVHPLGLGAWGVWYWAASENQNCVAVENFERHMVIDVRCNKKKKMCSLQLKYRDAKKDISVLVDALFQKGLCDFKCKASPTHEASAELEQKDFDAVAIKDFVLKYLNAIEEACAEKGR